MRTRMDEMRTSLFLVQLKATRMYLSELDKGERNPYTTADQVGNPYMKDVKIDIKDEDVKDVLELLQSIGLQSIGYDVSKLQ
ncbi:hypothetical protein ACA29_08550 [Lederbergia galactosidilytica]|uniref:Uncharacterized protein n=1 Tax=Lederbergia galactosidilytica TaxID=217031 RepID=A0A0Q9YBN4_9BACI|nr:hypothetical protein ACA29_08550 [Lederbergia galactosidilytica]